MDHPTMPECLRMKQCREIRINARVPIEWALPLYGFLMPLIVAITILTNSFIVVVLSHRSLRTPTNFVLGAMAITELLTGLLCLPWLLYYYTFGGYLIDEREGLPAFWCTLFPYLATSLPSIFHTAAIWLTVYLAVQRYIYICVPKLVRSQCTIRRSKQMIASICVLSVWIYAPELFASYNQSHRFTDPRTNRTRSMCLMSRTALIQLVGNNLYHMLLYVVHTVLVHTLPCILLVFFTWRLIAAIREADRKHLSLIGKPQQRKFTISPDDGPSSQGPGAPILRRCSLDPDSSDPNPNSSTNFAVLPKFSSAGDANAVHQQQQQQARGSLSESKRVQGLRQNTRMLLAVILLFLVTEIPAALIFAMHVGTVALKFTFLQQRHYAIINKLLIVRNVLIVISYPLRFAIYCGMSAQFREVVQQMLAKRNNLFAHFAYGKLRHRMWTFGGKEEEEDEEEGGSGTGSSPPHRKTTGTTPSGTAVMLRDQREAVIRRNGGELIKPMGEKGRRPTATESTVVGGESREEEESREAEEEDEEEDDEEDEEGECKL